MKPWKRFAVCCTAVAALTVSAAASSVPAASVPSPAHGAKRAQDAAPLPKTPDGIPENVKLELAKTGRVLVNQAAKHIMPKITAKAVTPGGKGGYVACYTAVDVADIRTEVFSAADPGKYLGSIRYVEYRYECPGTSEAEALRASCRVVQARQINELVRYEDGKWHY